MSIAAYRKTLSEKSMRLAIAECVARQGGRSFWVDRSDLSPSMTDFPDLVILLRGRGSGESGRVLFVELKSARRRVTDGQHEVMALLSECVRADAFIVRSCNPKDGEISYDAFLNFIGGSSDGV